MQIYKTIVILFCQICSLQFMRIVYVESGGKTWPVIYELPVMPSHVTHELQSAQNVCNLSASAYHSVVRILYEDMLHYTL